MAALKLFYNPISPPCRSIQMLMKMINVSYDLQEIDILSRGSTRELLSLNPMMKVPVLQDNDFTLYESHAIAPYLASKYDSNDSLYPKNIQARAMVDQKLHFDTGVLYPTLYRTIIPVLFKNQRGITISDANNIRRCYNFMNVFLRDQVWLCGNELTIADLSCLSTISTMDLLYPINSILYPHLAGYLQKCEKQKFYELNLVGLDKIATLIQEKFAAENHRTIEAASCQS